MQQPHRIDSLPSGSEIHGYIIESVLGSGAFGITYLAKHRHLGSFHVIKEYLPDCAMREHNQSTVSPKSASDRDLFAWGLKSFFDEAKLLHQLSHPHIVKVSDLFEANGTAYFVMPYLKGFTLHEWIKVHPNPFQDELEAIFVPLLEGLKYIHDRNLLHRDIKPENIYILENGHPILIDFGSARIAIGEKSKALTQVLTPHFAPHEQYRTKGTFTPALDLYGIAACMYQAITGKLPEEAPNRIEEDSQPKLVGSVHEGRYNSKFLRAIDKSLSVYAKDRHQDGFAFQKDLLGQYKKPLDATVDLQQHIHSKADNVPPGATAPAVTKERIPDYQPVVYNGELDERDKKVSPLVWAVLAVSFLILIGVFWPKINDIWQVSHLPSVSQPIARQQPSPPVSQQTITQPLATTHQQPVNFKDDFQCTDGNCINGIGTLLFNEGQKYVGEFKDGLFHGQGVWTHPDGDKYEGQFKDDNFHGQGTYIYADGRKYVGSYVNDMRHGQGTWTHPDGSRYVGEWKDDRPHGHGIMTLTDGDIYEGEFKDLAFHGQGTYTHADGRKYVGSFVNDMRHGQGTWTRPDGEKYVGEFKDGEFHGQGTWTFPSGQKYVGQLKDGIPHGQGTWTHPDGEKYIGEWKDGKEHGQGAYTWADGRRYVGQFKDGKEHGQGTHTWADGRRYVGEFKDGEFHGQGTWTHPDGNRYVGEYRDGLPNGRGTYTFSDGDRYTGDIKEGNFHGQGTYIHADGRKYVGSYVNDMRHGQGTWTHPDGSRYVGEYRDGQINGRGEYIWPDGRRYVGHFRNGQSHGHGVAYRRDGSVYFSGQWQNDQPVR